MTSIHRLQSPFQAEVPSENFQPVTTRAGEVTLSDATQRLNVESDSRATVSQPEPSLAADENQSLASSYSPVFGDPVASSAMRATLDAINASAASTSQAVADSPITNQLNDAVSPAKADLDSMNDMSDTTSLRLQMAMDRLSKSEETLSNVMKKVDDTSSTIVQNQK